MTTGPKCCRMLPDANRNRWALPRRGEAFPHPFPDPGRLMGVLGPVELRYFQRRWVTDGKSSRAAT